MGEDRMIAAYKASIAGREEEKQELEAYEVNHDKLEEEEERTVLAYEARIAAIESEHNIERVVQVLMKRGIDIPKEGKDDEDDSDDDDDDDDDNMSEGEL